uniref:Putative secreted protein n=1 Tax=Anopheles darlingi TaxID=43151 RepID=A0A2M4DDB0_ANODA
MVSRFGESVVLRFPLSCSLIFSLALSPRPSVRSAVNRSSSSRDHGTNTAMQSGWPLEKIDDENRQDCVVVVVVAAAPAPPAGMSISFDELLKPPPPTHTHSLPCPARCVVWRVLATAG